MATVLLLVIYIAFIGLGIPDSLFGTAWPAIYAEFHLPVSWANFVTLIISGCTICTSLISARLINRFGTAKITAVSTSMTAAALLGFSCSGGMLWLCLFAVPLGIGAGAIDSALNNYVALHYKAVHMNFLHCFYGIGVSLSPYLMSLALSAGGGWRGGYRTMFWIQLGIAALTVCTLPLWKKAGHAGVSGEEGSPQTRSVLAMLKMPRMRAACLIFIGSCAIEYTCGSWGSTFLVRAGGLEADAAARIITFYYAGMALGRFLSGLLAGKLTSWQLVRAGQWVTLAAIALLLGSLALSPAVSGAALFLIGLGNGPVFPNMIHLTTQHFGRELSQSAMGVEMASSYAGIMLAPLVFGLLAQYVTAALFPVYLGALYAVMTAGVLLMKKRR